MAKKKSRSANVARKREKRNRDRKSKSKQIAIEKQRKLPVEKMDEERLQACLLKSYDLIDEPEFETVHFDLDLMYTVVLELINGTNVNEISELPPVIEPEPQKKDQPDKHSQLLTQDSEEIYELFRTDVLSRLITPQFMKVLFSALNACETRYRRTGNYERAEVVLVARSLFEIVPPDLFAGHQLIQALGIQSLQLLVEQGIHIKEEQHTVREIISDVLDSDNSETRQENTNTQIYSHALSKQNSISEKPSQAYNSTETSVAGEPEISLNIPSPDSLPAKAIYQNFDGFEIKEILKGWTRLTPEKENTTQLDFFDEVHELYITVTENRVKLHALNDEVLQNGMDELESHCQSALMYLAKTFEEGGKSDGTE